jgi:hypothetical protein
MDILGRSSAPLNTRQCNTLLLTTINLYTCQCTLLSVIVGNSGEWERRASVARCAPFDDDDYFQQSEPELTRATIGMDFIEKTLPHHFKLDCNA